MSAAAPSALARAALAAGLCALVVACASCTRQATPQPPRGGPVPPFAPPSAPAPGASGAAPGLTRPASGPAVAYGWVMRVDLEGGFWALVDRETGASESDPPKVIVVLLPGMATEADIARLDGSFARASGTVRDGVSIRMSGPEMKVDSIEGSRNDVPE